MKTISHENQEDKIITELLRSLGTWSKSIVISQKYKCTAFKNS